MIAGFGLLPFEPGGMIVDPLVSWLLLLAVVALAGTFLWWTGRSLRRDRSSLEPGT